MFAFGTRSKGRLATCDWRLQEIHNHAIRHAPYDYGIACGHRSSEKQQSAFDNGLSDAKPGQSAHNRVDANGEPDSGATDIFIARNGHAVWGDESPQARSEIRELQMYIQGVAYGLGYRLSVMPTLKNGVEDLGHAEMTGVI